MKHSWIYWLSTNYGFLKVLVPISNFREYNTDFSRLKAFANDRTLTTSRDYLSLIWEKIVTYCWVKQKGFAVSLAKLHFYLAKNTLQLYCYQRIPSFSIFNVLVFWVPKSRYFAEQNRDHMKPIFDLFQSFSISKRRWKNGVISLVPLLSYGRKWAILSRWWW